jgi:Gluconate 2-dehydrogenase subunit 3
MRDSNQVGNQSRRDALKKLATGAGAMTAFPILGQAGVTPAMERAAERVWVARQAAATPGGESAAEWKPLFFDSHQNEMVAALAEMIIPETGTPGAKSALVNRFIDLLLSDEDVARQKAFIEGLAWIDGRSLRLHRKPFVELTAEAQTELLTALADPENKKPEDRRGVEFFQELKDLTIFGYYTSEAGMVRELEYGGDDYHTEFPGACDHPEHQT